MLGEETGRGLPWLQEWVLGARGRLTCEMLVWVRFFNFITADLCQHQQKLPVGWPGSEERSEGLPTSCHIHGTFSHWYLWTGLISLAGEGAAQLFNVKPSVAGGLGRSEQCGNFFGVAGKLEKLQTTVSVWSNHWHGSLSQECLKCFLILIMQTSFVSTWGGTVVLFCITGLSVL